MIRAPVADTTDRPRAARHRRRRRRCAGTSPPAVLSREAVRRERRRARRGRPARRRHRQAHRPLGRTTSSSCASPAPRNGSGGARSTSRSSPRASSACARRWPHTSASATSTSSTPIAGADPAHRIAVRIVTPSAFHALFARTMFIAPDGDGARRASSRTASCCTRPALEADPAEDGTRIGHVHRAPSDRAGQVLIGGTFYAGEIKKSIFTLLNDRLPLDGVFPMHCSANVGDDGRRGDLLRSLRHRQDDALGRPASGS